MYLIPTKRLTEYCITANHKYKIINNGYTGITILYVLDGSIEITYEEQNITLFTGNILLINRNAAYRIHSETDNIVLTLEIANNYFARYYKDYFNHRYELADQNSPDFKKKYIDNIKLLLAKIMVSHIKGREESLLEIHRSLSDMLLTLISFFQKKSTKRYKNNITMYSQRIKKIIYFLEENYNQRITLQQVADSKHDRSTSILRHVANINAVNIAAKT